MLGNLGTTRRLRYRGEDAVELANAELSVLVVPARGAKVVSLRDRLRDVEWLAAPIRGWSTPTPGDWLSQDCGGWDECFPNVVSEPHPLTGQLLAGHGEVWSRPWRLEDAGSTRVVTSIVGTGLPFLLTRTLTLRANRLTCHYRLENLADEPLLANWLMHLLLEVVPSLTMTLPTGGTARHDPDTGPFAAGRDAAHGSSRSELNHSPEFQGLHENPNPVFRERPTATASKWITDRHTASSCLVQRSAAGLLVKVDPERVPQFGLWINDGGWPEAAPQRHLGIEAALGGFDRLSRAYEEGSAIRLGGHRTKEWSVELSTQSASASQKKAGHGTTVGL